MPLAPSGPTDLENQLAFETLISDVSARLAAAPDEAFASTIETALAETTRFLGADRGQVLSVDAPRSAVRVLQAWYADTLESRAPFPAESFAEHMPWAADLMVMKRQPLVVSALDELPPEAQRDRASFIASGVRSALWIPIAIGPDLRYVLSVEATHGEVHWPRWLPHRLLRLGEILGHTVERQRVAGALHETNARIALAKLAEAQHRAAIAHLEGAVDAAGLGFYVWTPPGETGILDERARDLLGVPPEQDPRLEAFWLEHVHPDDREGVIQAIREVQEEGVERLSRIYRYQHPTRGLLWFQHTTRTFERDRSGRPTRVAGVLQDVTEQKRIEWGIRERETRLEAAAELAGLGFYEIDFVEGRVFVDHRFRDVCGVPPERLQDLQIVDFWLEHVHPDDRPRVVDLRRQMHSEGLDRGNIEYRFLHPTRGERWLQHVSTVAGRHGSPGAIRTFGILRDITERKRAEEELSTLSRRLLRAQEAERALLARELHDDVTQRMAVLAIELGRAESSTPGVAQSDTLRAVREGLVRLSEDIHTLAYQLHPAVLEELGLAEALRTECERKGRHGGIEVTLHLDPAPAAVGKDATLCLYRVAQEALNNVARHARARTASVTLQQVDGGLLLAIRDDGVGFDPGDPGNRGSLGLVSMRERLRLVNGTLDIDTAPGQGTVIVAWVPGEGGQS
jgi:PAS domain S-box-containing protein